MTSGGLRTVVYQAGNLAVAQGFYARSFGIQPDFDEPFYVGFNLGGYELGPDPDTSTPPGPAGPWLIGCG